MKKIGARNASAGADSQLLRFIPGLACDSTPAPGKTQVLFRG
jgi:hypothetical protein